MKEPVHKLEENSLNELLEISGDSLMNAVANLVVEFEGAVLKGGLSPDEIPTTKQELFNLISEQVDEQLSEWESTYNWDDDWDDDYDPEQEEEYDVHYTYRDDLKGDTPIPAKGSFENQGTTPEDEAFAETPE